MNRTPQVNLGVQKYSVMYLLFHQVKYSLQQF